MAKKHLPYGGRAKAQRAGISKHITAVKYKTYNCKITKLHSTEQQSMSVEQQLTSKKTYK